MKKRFGLTVLALAIALVSVALAAAQQPQPDQPQAPPQAEQPPQAPEPPAQPQPMQPPDQPQQQPQQPGTPQSPQQPNTPPPMPHPPHDPLGDAMFPPEMIMQHQRELGLTDQQKTFMRGEINKTTTRFNELQWQLQDAMEVLHETMKANVVNEQQALAQLDKVLDNEREIKRLHMELAIRIKNNLTPEQQTKLQGVRHRPGFGGPGHGPGHGPGPSPGGAPRGPKPGPDGPGGPPRTPRPDQPF